MPKKIFYFLFLIFSLFSYNLFSDNKKDWIAEEEKAKKLFNKEQYDEAIILFREIILSSDNEKLKRESYFWIAKTYININKYKQAEINLEYYLSNFKSEGLNYPEAVYQKGRLLFLQEQYQIAIEQLNIFIKNYPDNDLLSNAYYWIGESLYALGQFDDSAFIFNIIVNKFPNSSKKEASAYKLRLIEHKKSELSLQNLLKWSQEQYISSLNQFKIKEKTLQQAIDSYEKNKDKSIDNDKVKKIVQENDNLKQKIAELEEKIKKLENFSDKDLTEKLKQLELKEKLLAQKEEALKLFEEDLREKEKTLEK